MSEITDDVLNIVDDIIAIHRKLEGASLSGVAVMKTLIAEAIMDERDACAAIAEKYAAHSKTAGERQLCEEIGTIIRYSPRVVGEEA